MISRFSRNQELRSRRLGSVRHSCTQVKHHYQTPLVPIARVPSRPWPNAYPGEHAEEVTHQCGKCVGDVSRRPTDADRRPDRRATDSGGGGNGDVPPALSRYTRAPVILVHRRGLEDRRLSDDQPRSLARRTACSGHVSQMGLRRADRPLMQSPICTAAISIKQSRCLCDNWRRHLRVSP